MKKVFFFLLLFFLLVIYIYSVIFVFLPISAKIILEFLCLLLCLKYIVSSRYLLRKEYKSIINTLFVIILWDVFTSVLNWGTEFYLVKKMITILGSIFTAHYVYQTFLRISKDKNMFFLIIFLVILSETILSLLMKIFPSIFDLVASFLVFDFEGEGVFNSIFLTGRFHGIGIAVFFGVLPSTALGLMTAMYFFFKATSIVKKTFFIISWLFILIISFLTARYTILIGAISILYYLILISGKNLIRNIFVFIAIAGGLYFAFSLITEYADATLLGWAFGAFTGDEEGGNSVNYLKDWWLNTSYDIKTFLIGDARYSVGEGYYMGVDIGIMRQIFYGGIIGLLLNINAHYKILKFAYTSDKKREFKYFLIFLLLCYIAILTKGDTYMMSFFLLYLVACTNGIFIKKT